MQMFLNIFVIRRVGRITKSPVRVQMKKTNYKRQPRTSNQVDCNDWNAVIQVLYLFVFLAKLQVWFLWWKVWLQKFIVKCKRVSSFRGHPINLVNLSALLFLMKNVDKIPVVPIPVINTMPNSKIFPGHPWENLCSSTDCNVGNNYPHPEISVSKILFFNPHYNES
jgi:hypothetical protein